MRLYASKLQLQFCDLCPGLSQFASIYLSAYVSARISLATVFHLFTSWRLVLVVVVVVVGGGGGAQICPIAKMELALDSGLVF